MKNFLSFVLVLAFIMSCKAQTKENNTELPTKETTYLSVGKQIDDKDVLSADQMAIHYKGMKVGDTINSKMIAKVGAVCQMKGCWMTLNLEDGNEVMVRFKDYGFFVPKDIAGKEVIVNGLAYVKETSVEEQRHYAEDAGKSEEEIATITSPKKSYAFEADGVLIKE